jgi:hypothetical protein
MTLCLREDDLDWRAIDDEIVALDGRDGLYLSVHGAGTVVWSLLDGTRTRDGLVEAVAGHYGIEEARAADDVDAFLNLLASRGLLAA